MIEPKKIFMEAAIEQALAAKQEGDYAIGTVLVIGDEIVSAWGSRVKRDESPIAHSEILAILDASQKLKSRHLINAILYSTQEPCPMCASAAVFARLKGIVFGASIEDMKNYVLKNPGSPHLGRVIDISCERIITTSYEDTELVKHFMQGECLDVLADAPALHAPVDEKARKI
jgi:tRNA(Arg) A34 adenosine deaminase TadA